MNVDIRCFKRLNIFCLRFKQLNKALENVIKIEDPILAVIKDKKVIGIFLKSKVFNTKPFLF